MFFLLLLKTIPALPRSTEPDSTFPDYGISSNGWLAVENQNTEDQELGSSHVIKMKIDQEKDEESNNHQIARKEPSIYPKTESEKKGGEVQAVDYVVFVFIGIFFFLIIIFLITVSKTCVIKSMSRRRGTLRKTQYRPSVLEARVTPSPSKGIFNIS